MSISVGLINRKNSQSYEINFKRSKLSKNVDSNTKSETKFTLIYKELSKILVELRRIELLTPCLQSKCSPSWATAPLKWWAQKDSNLRPQSYQGCALTNWAMGPRLSVCITACAMPWFITLATNTLASVRRRSSGGHLNTKCQKPSLKID